MIFGSRVAVAAVARRACPKMELITSSLAYTTPPSWILLEIYGAPRRVIDRFKWKGNLCVGFRGMMDDINRS